MNELTRRNLQENNTEENPNKEYTRKRRNGESAKQGKYKKTQCLAFAASLFKESTLLFFLIADTDLTHLNCVQKNSFGALHVFTDDHADPRFIMFKYFPGYCAWSRDEV